MHCLCSSLSAIVYAKFTSKFTNTLLQTVKHTTVIYNSQGCFTCRLRVGSVLFFFFFWKFNLFSWLQKKWKRVSFGIGVNCVMINFVIVKPSIGEVVSINLYTCNVSHRQSWDFRCSLARRTMSEHAQRLH